MLPAVETFLKAVAERALAPAPAPTLYDLEALTQVVIRQIGQVILQEVTTAQGSGLVGPTRPCGCGAEQTYHDQARQVVIQTSVGTSGWSAARTTAARPVGRPAIRWTSAWGWGGPGA
jgi:hypothetical protein